MTPLRPILSGICQLYGYPAPGSRHVCIITPQSESRGQIFMDIGSVYPFCSMDLSTDKPDLQRHTVPKRSYVLLNDLLPTAF
jgi:hypothetical protein